MSAPDIYRQLQRLARQQGRPSDELMTLYGLERILDRLTRTVYRDDFSLKGGVLLAAYRLRRPTRDIDMQALDFRLDEKHLRDVVAAIAAVDAPDGLILGSEISVQQIRDEDDYSGLRVSVPATLHTYRFVIRLDISTGDPIWPAPQLVTLPGLLGEDVTIMGHPMVTVIAEKAVTVLQRGTTSTRWRDFVDLANLARTYPFTAGDVRSAATATAAHRHVELRALASVTAGYGDVAQPKWSAWRLKNDMGGVCAARFEDQLADVIAFIDPIFTGDLPDTATWDPLTYAWQ